MALVLVDSSAVLALLNKRDQWHDKAKIVLQTLVNQQASLIMTNYLVAECHSLLLARIDANIARRWLLTLDWNIIYVTLKDEHIAKDIIRKYTDKDFSLTDATAFVIMQRHNIKVAFTFDNHYEQFGFDTVGRSQNMSFG